MWRMLVHCYDSVQSAVLVNGELTDFFEVLTGVRQGCVLSPILYTLFIEGLIRRIKELGCGVVLRQPGEEAGESAEIALLLFADDILLLAPDKNKLQLMLDGVEEYAKKWRFVLNQSKSQCMVFGVKSRLKEYEKNWIPYCGRNDQGEKTFLKIVRSYKYLGIEVTADWNMNLTKRTMELKARRNMQLAYSMGVSKGLVTIKAGVNIWNALVRSVLEYGVQVWIGNEQWKEAELIQRSMSGLLLNTIATTTTAFLRCSKKA